MLAITATPIFFRGSSSLSAKPFLTISIEQTQPPELDANEYSALCDAFDELFGESFMCRHEQNRSLSLIHCMLTSIQILGQKTYQHFDFEVLEFKTLESEDKLIHEILVTCPDYFKKIYVSLLMLLLSGACPPEHQSDKVNHNWRLAVAGGDLKRLFKKIAAGPPSIITRHLVRAALQKRIPCTQIDGDVWRFGLGSQSKYFLNSFTEGTTALGANLARDKFVSANLLQRSGLPNLGGIKVESADDAVAVAEKIGFPVVVKPVSFDGGAGVGCNLQSAEQVREQMAKTQEVQKQVLIQKHVAGKDYRVTIANNKVLAVIERIPGGVTGDGYSSIEALIESINQQPMRGIAAHLPLYPITLDDEALSLLSAADLTPESVLEDGRFFALRRAANVASGGTPVDVLAQVHPDNLTLAIEATKVFRLDLAGVDLILPDAMQSYRQTGGYVCEVNAQPVLGYSTTAHIYPLIVGGLVKDEGRIPISFILAQKNNRHLDRFLGKLLQQQESLGIVHKATVSLGRRHRTRSQGNSFDDLEILFSNPSCNRAICVVDDPRLLQSGLPVDRIDRVILWEEHSLQGSPLLESPLSLLAKYATEVVSIQEYQREGDTNLQQGVRVNSVAASELAKILLFN